MATALAEILFKEYRRKVLGLLLLSPARRYHVREIARLTGTVAGTINKELKKLAEAGVLSASRQGNQLLYAANTDCPIYEELVGILRKTSGIAEVLAEALLPLADRIEAAFVFGSVASGKAGNDSDIDFCVVGDVAFGEVVRALYPSQELLAREINPKCFSVREWSGNLKTRSAFMRELLEKPVINVIGNRDDLG